ncbi:NAD(P)/FAD-dependent oxidoreductase [Nocardia uniformis]|uniref:NAD(P)/FAD-dependent oxidoreductase n=2 Tax=Nocardia uniformis TaxID=53432 RepID=A0A849BW76_9NOCA|nr:NAD(P)/FAD-dependent oxidoreductase [Nocardia uniformis]
MAVEEFDVLIVGAGFSGLYTLHRFRQQGYSVRVLEAADGIGGTWYWNTYPGARCDAESIDYSYSFSPELEQEWTWTERYAAQPEILRYVDHVVERFDLRRDIRTGARVVTADYDENSVRWDVAIESGERFRSRYLIFATGGLSAPLEPPFPGVERFTGESYRTQMWPHEPVDLRGKRVAVVGTGSSGVQLIPVVAEQAARLTVFQRTANFSVPGRNRPLTAEEIERVKRDYPTVPAAQRNSHAGLNLHSTDLASTDMTESEQRARLEEQWALGGSFEMAVAFSDVALKMDANGLVADFIRAKIREQIGDRHRADLLTPRDHPYVGKRPCVDHGYYETFNRDNVDLVDIRSDPIAEITPTGITLTSGIEYETDVIVYANGYDAITGAINRIDIRGRGGKSLRELWSDGPRTYLGYGVAGFPNLLMVGGPGSPSIVVMAIALAEQQVEWLLNCLDHLRAAGIEEFEPTERAQDSWTELVAQLAAAIPAYANTESSYYNGANVPGKPRGYPMFMGGWVFYRQICGDVAAQGYVEFKPPARG